MFLFGGRKGGKEEIEMTKGMMSRRGATRQSKKETCRFDVVESKMEWPLAAIMCVCSVSQNESSQKSIRMIGNHYKSLTPQFPIPPDLSLSLSLSPSLSPSFWSKEGPNVVKGRQASSECSQNSSRQSYPFAWISRCNQRIVPTEEWQGKAGGHGYVLNENRRIRRLN